jgi:cytochrome c oxidase cbb3-type subunit 4
MTHFDVVQLVGTWGQIYIIAIFIVAAAYALWPRNKAKFDRAARIPLDDESGPQRREAGERP